MYIKVLFLVNFVLLGICSQAQDLIFPQVEHSPLQINPAYAGQSDYLYRLRGVGTSQWFSSLGSNQYRSASGSFDAGWKIGDDAKFGAGLTSSVDQSGSTQFRNTQYKMSLSLTYDLSHSDEWRNQLSFGVELGRGTQSFNFNGIGGARRISTAYNDIGVGILWDVITINRLKFQLASSVLHLNNPDISFTTTSTNILPHRFSNYLKLSIPIYKGYSLITDTQLQLQGAHESYFVGVGGKYQYPTRSQGQWIQSRMVGQVGQSIATDLQLTAYGADVLFRYDNYQLGVVLLRYAQIRSYRLDISLSVCFGSYEQDL